MAKISDILIIDSDSSMLLKLQEMAIKLGIPSTCIAKPDTIINELRIFKTGVALIGPSLERATYLKCIHKIKIIDTAVPILLAVHPGLFAAICDDSPIDDLYFISPKLDPDDVSQAIQSASKHRKEPKPTSDNPLIIGQSEAVREIRRKIKLLSDKDITVLITGESGTGKELVAQHLHYNSPRNGGSLIKVNCAALPDELLESEIFGFQKGAFTGAHKDKPGRLELAHEGTLFLDEIGDLSHSLQAKILQVLEDKEFSRLGDTAEKVVNARIVAATNQDLATKVKAGMFRNDLFYRLNVINIRVPPLRERMDDIPFLTDYFLNKCLYEINRGSFKLSAKAVRHLETYHWPGNIRELENMIRRLVAFGNPSILLEQLDLENATSKEHGEGIPHSKIHETLWNDSKIMEIFQRNNYSLKKTSKAFASERERQEILKALRETNWNRKKAAKMLKVSYKTLLNRLIDLHLQE
jgi:two-component system response regulator AtoC